MDVDADAALDGFLSDSADVRRQALEALQRRQRADPGLLAEQLAARCAGAGAARSSEAGPLAAVLLRKVLHAEAARVASAGPAAAAGLPGGRGAAAAWCRQGLGDALLGALAGAVQEPATRLHVADAVATAASAQFGRGRAWPELSLLLARWCEGGFAERAVVLRVLEHLRDEARQPADEAAPLYALLAFLHDHGGPPGALHVLLTTALREDEGAPRASAARVLLLCAAGPGVPPALRDSVRDLAPVLAEAGLGAWALFCQSGGQPCAELADLDPALPGGPGADASYESSVEACFQSVALLARADGATWAAIAAGVARGPDGGLPAALAEAAAQVRLGTGARGAAVAALLELTEAAFEHCPDAAGPLSVRAAAAVVGALEGLPADEATDQWAEEADSDDEAPRGRGDEGRPGGCDEDDGGDGLLDAALDAAAALAARGGEGAESLRCSVETLLAQHAWQARHSALLLALRLAVAEAPPGGAACAAAARAAQLHLQHAHPRVRWAAAEVWARLLAMGHSAPLSIFGDAVESLMAVAGDDCYARVRRRGLLVLLLGAGAPEPPLPLTAKAPALLRRVLVLQAASPDDAVREAVAGIAKSLAGALGLLAAPAGSAGAGWLDTLDWGGEDVLAQLGVDLSACTCVDQAELWHSLAEGLRRGAELAEGAAGVTGEIEWPADWR